MVSVMNLRALSVLSKITLLIIIITLLVIGYNLFVYFGYTTIKINGPVYNEIVSGKNLIADILPPSGYIIEPYQISLALLEEGDPVIINRSVATLNKLEEDYKKWYENWILVLPPGEIRDSIRESYVPAMRFWNDLDSRFIPAIEKGDQETANRVAYDSLKTNYQEHRVIIDRIVLAVEEQNRHNEEAAESKERFVYVGMVFIAVILLIALLLVEIIIIRMLRPLRDTTLMIEEMSRGRLSKRMKMNRSDEIGKMASAMDNLAEYIQETFSGLSRIAHGDLDVSFQAKSEEDEIASAFNNLIQEIDNIMNQVRFLITEAEEGRLKNRGSPDQFSGIYREIVLGINNMLNAITTPLNEAIRVADEFSYAHFSTRFEDSVPVKGEYVALKEGMNTIGEELLVVRYKLSLLSSITRHDILNQITVIKSGLDLIEDNDGTDRCKAQVLSLIRTAVSNIKEQINFTAIYEQMGVQQPVWHRIPLIIAKTRDSLNTDAVVILDYTHNLEILADQMFGQVVYNLTDNALKHGKSLTRISFSFESWGEDGIFVMSDNGVGIAEEDKARIFQRGFGKNTGLGLFLIREILSFTKITIKETGKVGSGARFEMHIPAGKWRVVS